MIGKMAFGKPVTWNLLLSAIIIGKTILKFGIVLCSNRLMNYMRRYKCAIRESVHSS
jgi:hypothetical protein